MDNKLITEEFFNDVEKLSNLLKEVLILRKKLFNQDSENTLVKTYECIEELEIINEDKSITKFEKFREFKIYQLSKINKETFYKHFKLINNDNKLFM